MSDYWMDEEHSQESSNILLGRFRASQFTEHVEDMVGRRILPGDVMMQFGTSPPSVELARALDVVTGSPYRNGGRPNLVTEQMLTVQERDNRGPRRIQFNGVIQGAFGIHAGSSSLIDPTRWLLSKPDLFHGIGRQLSPANPGGASYRYGTGTPRTDSKARYRRNPVHVDALGQSVSVGDVVVRWTEKRQPVDDKTPVFATVTGLTAHKIRTVRLDGSGQGTVYGDSLVKIVRFDDEGITGASPSLI